MKIEIEISELQELLNYQRQSCAEHISRNLSVYTGIGENYNSEILKSELRCEARKAPYPSDFNVLKKYIKTK
jgi:hypothetical protein